MKVQIPPFTDYEAEILANLCIIETRDFAQPERCFACWSVIDTVMTRVETGILSDGTIPGTITWGCNAGDMACQFPAYAVGAVDGCAGLIPSACPYNHERDWAERAVATYWRMRAVDAITCGGFLYYGIMGFDEPECRIEDEAGVFTNWHEEVENE